MERQTVCLRVEEVAQNLELEILEPGNGSVVFSTGEIGRPGLQFTGFYEHFMPQRVQLIGNAEMHYLRTLTYEDISARMERFMGFKIPCIVCARGNTPPEALLDCAKKHAVPVFKSDMHTDDLGHRILSYVGRELAPRILLHGVLLDVFGVGVLLQGPSGIGKSETAIEMIKMGHRLVADDVVEITRVAPNRLSGRAPERLARVFGNRAVRFLSAISYNFYIWHQFLAVKLKEFHIPAYVSEFPQMSEGRAWQTKYTLLCFAAAFLLSAALTYLVEKPAGRALLRLRARKEKV